MDEINFQQSEGKDMMTAIIDSGVSRLRPVAMAASTTALGMVPLLFDGFFAAMAVTIIFGLMFATMLTMIVLPVLFTIMYRVPNDSTKEPTPDLPAHISDLESYLQSMETPAH